MQPIVPLYATQITATGYDRDALVIMRDFGHQTALFDTCLCKDAKAIAVLFVHCGRPYFADGRQRYLLVFPDVVVKKGRNRKNNDPLARRRNFMLRKGIYLPEELLNIRKIVGIRFPDLPPGTEEKEEKAVRAQQRLEFKEALENLHVVLLAQMNKKARRGKRKRSTPEKSRAEEYALM